MKFNKHLLCDNQHLLYKTETSLGQLSIVTVKLEKELSPRWGKRRRGRKGKGEKRKGKRKRKKGKGRGEGGWEKREGGGNGEKGEGSKLHLLSHRESNAHL